MGFTAIGLNSYPAEQWYSLLQQRLKVHLHCLKGVYAILAHLTLNYSQSWHNTSHHRLSISAASWWKTHFGRPNSITKQTLTYSLSYDIGCVCSFHCQVLVVMLDGCTVGKTWKLRSLLRDAHCRRGECRIRFQSNAQCRKLSSTRVLNLVSRLHIHEVPGGSAGWSLGLYVFVNQQNAGYIPNRMNSSIYIPSSRLHLDSHFLPYYTQREQLNTPAAITHTSSNYTHRKHPELSG